VKVQQYEDKINYKKVLLTELEHYFINTLMHKIKANKNLVEFVLYYRETKT